MVLLETPICDFGQPAIDFNLPGVDGQNWSLDKSKGKNGVLILFICNHCPYVKAIQTRLVDTIKEIQALGIGVVAIMANDPKDYPEDSFENMKLVSEEYGFSFPYLIDETQKTAKAYGAVCTPDYFGYNADLKLQYRGRLDEGVLDAPPADAKNELFEAMKLIAETGQGPKEQTPSMGCSIKWIKASG